MKKLFSELGKNYTLTQEGDYEEHNQLAYAKPLLDETKKANTTILLKKSISSCMIHLIVEVKFRIIK